MIFILLTKVITLYMEFTKIEIQEPGFKKTLLRVWFSIIYLRLKKQIYAEFCDFLKVFLSVLSRNHNKIGV